MNDGTGEQSHHDIRPSRAVAADQGACWPIEPALNLVFWPPLLADLLTGPSNRKDHLKASTGASISVSRSMALLGIVTPT